MSEVYAADDLSLKRPVAIKILLPETAADSSLRIRFEREARSLASIKHPNVETIHEIGVYEKRPYFIGEYIEGKALRDIIGKGPLPVESIIDLAVQISSGLTAIHQIGMVHRDIKPSNIVVDTGGRVCIIDFGIVQTGSGEEATADQPTLGTIGYMSPEQVRGEPVTPASDLFSLGIVLYEMATGARPFRGEYEAAVQYAIVHEDPAPVTSYRDDLPEWLARLIETLLEKRPERRHESAESIRDTLTVHSSGKMEKSTARSLDLRKRRLFVPVSLLAVIILAALIVVFFPRPSGKATPATLAVMPFRNLGSPEDAYFAEGMTDAIITHLARVKNLRVISRLSSMKYGDSAVGFGKIASELGAGYILTGTVYWDKSVDPEQIRINTQLVRSEDESCIWGDEYTGILRKVISLQSEIAGKVTAVLEIALSDADQQSLKVIPTSNLEAYDYFLRGNHYFNRSWDQSNILIATEMFEHAVELDTTFAAAYAMLARGHESIFWEYYDRSEDRCRLARLAAGRALALRPDLAEGHLARGYVLYHCDQDYEKALEEFHLGLVCSPNHTELYNAIAAVQRRQGKLEAAVDNFKLSFSLDPRSPRKTFDIALTYGLMRHFKEAERYLDQTLELAPEWPLPYIYRAWIYIFQTGDTAAANEVLARAAGRADISASRYYWWISRIVLSDYEKGIASSHPGPDTAGYLLHCARLYRLMGRDKDEYRCADSARRILEDRVAQRPDDARYHSQLGLAYAGLRRKAEAIEHSRKALELLPTSRDAFDPIFFVVDLAEVLVIFDENDAAIDQLEHLMSIPGFMSRPYLKLDPLWDPLRSNPRFQKLLQSA